MSKNAATPVAILTRVSTSRQETRRQLNELTEHAKARNYRIVEVCGETVSGAADEAERAALQRIIELAEGGKIRKVLVHEISRIARRNSVAHNFVEKLDASGVSLYWHAQGIETLLPNGKRNPAAGIMLAVLAEMARAELETLKARIASGLAEARRKGKKLGRPFGTKLERAAFLQKHRDIVRLLKAGQSVRNTAKLSKWAEGAKKKGKPKGFSTVQRVKAALAG